MIRIWSSSQLCCLPFYQFPNPLEAEAQLLGFVHDALADGLTPILLAYSLGKTQEALAVLKDNDIPTLMHSTAVSMTEACRDAGVEGLPEPVEFTGEVPEGHVILAPPHSLKTKLYRAIPNKRTAMLIARPMIHVKQLMACWRRFLQEDSQRLW